MTETSVIEKSLEYQQKPDTDAVRKFVQAVEQNWRKHFVLFSEVKNKVIEVNPNVLTPLKLEKGQPTPLGLFAQASYGPWGKRAEETPGKRILEFWPRHMRSAIVGRMLFADKEGHIYRDVDIKGIGSIFDPENFADLQGLKRRLRPLAQLSYKLYFFIPSSLRVVKPGAEHNTGGREGLLDKKTALYDFQNTEAFSKAGIRTNVTLAIVELEEIVVKKHKLSLDEARKQGIIDANFQPVVEVRAFTTKARIGDLNPYLPRKTRLLLFEDAKKLVAQEINHKQPLTDKEYLNWFAKTLGYNVGLMHRNGWAHHYLGRHNITLDCRIVDLDSVNVTKDEGEFTQDNKDAQQALILLARHVLGRTPNRNEYDLLQKQFQESYQSGLLSI